MSYRKEEDTMGIMPIPEEAYFGPQTQRAVENFPISSLRFPPCFITALALIKFCAASVNLELGLLDRKLATAIMKAAIEIEEGKLYDQFVVDIFQTGSGTSTNMNMNEVIAGRANEIITGKRGGKTPVHPNDHVNLGQSSNDVIPSTINIAAIKGIHAHLLPSLRKLHRSLEEKSEEFADIRKTGRTHLQDALPVTLGQEFGGYARQIELAMERVHKVEGTLAELALGGTAVGTGVNTHPEFAGKVIALISKKTGYGFREAKNHFEAQGASDGAVETSGALKTLAVSLMKMANDIRLLSSGPRCGLGEITLPSLQPGSSIMPGKVNPVIPEVVIQVGAQVIGNDTAICQGGLGGYLELNTMLPIIAHNLLQSIDLLSSAALTFAEKCIDGISANREKCQGNVEKSLALSTFLVPVIGYDKAAIVAKKAFDTDKTIQEILLEEGLATREDINRLFNMEIQPR